MTIYMFNFNIPSFMWQLEICHMIHWTHITNNYNILGIMAALKLHMKLNSKKMTRKFVQHQTNISKLSITGRKPNVLTIVWSSRARPWQSTLVMGAISKWYTWLLGNSWSITSRNQRCFRCTTNLTLLRLLTIFSPRTTKP